MYLAYEWQRFKYLCASWLWFHFFLSHTKLSITVALVYLRNTKHQKSHLKSFAVQHLSLSTYHIISFKMKSSAVIAFAAAALVAPALAQDAASLATLLPSCAVSKLISSDHMKHD